MAHRSVRDILDYANEVRQSLFEEPIRLRDIRSRMSQLEDFAGSSVLKRSIVGEVSGIVKYYYPLPEWIALYRRKQQIYWDHVEAGDFDDSNYKNVLILGAYSLCTWWLKPDSRHPYGDVRLLRPILGEVLIESAEWPRSPYPEESAALGEWYEELAPGGALYPSDEHLEYVERFEAFAEDIVWDSRGRDFITIINFPAPPNPQPLTQWWSTQHILD